VGVAFREERTDSGGWAFHAKVTRLTQAQAYLAFVGVASCAAAFRGTNAGWITAVAAVMGAFLARPRPTALTLSSREVTYSGKVIARSIHDVEGVEVAPVRKKDPTSPPLLHLRLASGARVVIDVGSMQPTWLQYVASRIERALEDVKNRGGYRV
jgi:hypothetical protein